MLAQEFIRNALVAGSAIAIASGAVGYFVVLRAQVFAGDALSHVAFTGVLAAALAGIDLRVGLFAATIAVALLFAALGDRIRVDDAAIGVVFAWVLGLGVLFLFLFSRGAGGSNGAIAARTLFGSLFSLSANQTELAAGIAALVVAGIVGISRPLLFATIAPDSAAARGVPVGALGAAFLVLLAIDAAEATQAVGALLLLGLIAAPAGAAMRLTAEPGSASQSPARPRSPRSGSGSRSPTWPRRSHRAAQSSAWPSRSTSRPSRRPGARRSNGSRRRRRAARRRARRPRSPMSSRPGGSRSRAACPRTPPPSRSCRRRDDDGGPRRNEPARSARCPSRDRCAGRSPRR